jgi:hypothetical protein
MQTGRTWKGDRGGDAQRRAWTAPRLTHFTKGTRWDSAAPRRRESRRHPRFCARPSSLPWERQSVWPLRRARVGLPCYELPALDASGGVFTLMCGKVPICTHVNESPTERFGGQTPHATHMNRRWTIEHFSNGPRVAPAGEAACSIPPNGVGQHLGGGNGSGSSQAQHTGGGLQA